MSVAEAETVALAKAAVECLGLAVLAEELGIGKIRPRIFLRTDSTASQGICGRRGLGILNHWQVRELWLQQVVRQQRLDIERVPTQTNPADVLTKYRPRDAQRELLDSVGVQLLMEPYDGPR